VSSFPAFALLNRHLQLVLRIDSCWVHQGGFFLPLGFTVGHATLKVVLHASVNFFTVPSSSCGRLRSGEAEVQQTLLYCGAGLFVEDLLTSTAATPQ